MVKNGWITLEGEAEWQYQRELAEMATRLKGVRGVTTRSTHAALAPSDVKRKIEEALKRNAAVEAEQITVEMNGGEVILRGTVHSWVDARKSSGPRGRRPA